MKKTIVQYISLTAFVFCSYSIQADAGKNKEIKFEHGNKMHSDHCYKCHTDKVYTRDNRFVKSLDALGKQVVRCKDNTGAPWFDADTDAVVHFLNEKYYKF